MPVILAACSLPEKRATETHAGRRGEIQYLVVGVDRPVSDEGQSALNEALAAGVAAAQGRERREVALDLFAKALAVHWRSRVPPEETCRDNYRARSMQFCGDLAWRADVLEAGPDSMRISAATREFRRMLENKGHEPARAHDGLRVGPFALPGQFLVDLRGRPRAIPGPSSAAAVSEPESTVPPVSNARQRERSEREGVDPWAADSDDSADLPAPASSEIDRSDAPRDSTDQPTAPNPALKPSEPPPEPRTSPVPPGVYYGVTTFKDRDRGCTFIDDDQLSIIIDSKGSVEWSGYSAAEASCPGQVIEPTRCRHQEAGTIERVGKKIVLNLKVSGSQGIPFTPLDRQVWSCGRLQVVVPNAVSLGGSCRLMGRPDPATSEVAANEFVCANTNPWRSLEHAEISVTRSELTVPRGTRRRLVLRRQNR